MGEQSKIQWTDHTVNFWTGCKKVSPGCKFCYMYRDKERYGKDPTDVVQTNELTYFKTLRSAKRGDKIFTCSWSDFFIEEADPWRSKAWDIIRFRDDLIFQILTKRPGRIMECLPPDYKSIKNVWIGVSIETQPFTKRIELIKDLPWLKFASVEPMLRQVDLSEYTQYLDWVIIGGESGNDNGKYLYRPCEVEWIEKIILNCNGAGVPVFVKQLGTHLAKKLGLKDRHGGNIDEWPYHLQIRQFPNNEQ